MLVAPVLYDDSVSDTYVAYFARNRGRIFHCVGQEVIDLRAGEPLEELTWGGERWIRISDLRGGGADYLPEDLLA